MEALTNLVVLAWMVSLIILVLGVIRPSFWLAKLPERYRTRLFAFSLFFSLSLFLFVLSIAFLVQDYTHLYIFGVICLGLIASSKHAIDKKYPSSQTVPPPQKSLSQPSLEKRVKQPSAKKEKLSKAIQWVPSFSDTGEVYEVHTQKLTCSCPDWNKRRFYYHTSDPRRLCKHLIYAIPLEELEKKYGKRDGLFEFLEDYEKGFPLDS